MKIAYVHDWFYSISGGEKVVEAMYEALPGDIYTLVKNPKNLTQTTLPCQSIKTSFIQRLPFSKTHYEWYLPLFPKAIESLDLRGYDVIISSSSCLTKSVLTSADQLHICYCHTPMRYIWDLYFDALNTLSTKRYGLGLVLPKIFASLAKKLRDYDVTTSKRVDHFVANSHHVAKRIQKTYRRQSTVIYPPVDTESFSTSSSKKTSDYYVTVSRLVPYKKVDLIINAFKMMPEKKLIVIGQGPQEKYLRKISPTNVEIISNADDNALREYLSKAKAFIFAAQEDFGISVVEAQCMGLPVIAYGKGGALETVVANKTGLFYNDQTVKALTEKIADFEKIRNHFEKDVISDHAKQFSKKRFQHQLTKLIEDKLCYSANKD